MNGTTRVWVKQFSISERRIHVRLATLLFGTPQRSCVRLDDGKIATVKTTDVFERQDLDPN